MKVGEILNLGANLLYHGTVRERLPMIAAMGLCAQARSNWIGYHQNPHLAYWSVGNVFLTPRLDDALYNYYARMSAALTGGHPAIIRVPLSAVTDARPDPRGWGSADLYTPGIRSDPIQVWTRAGGGR